MGYERRATARYSFLLAIPAVVGSEQSELYKTVKNPGLEAFSTGETTAAAAVAFVVGLLVIVFFMNDISKRSFLPFVIYRLLLGLALIILLATGVMQPL